MRIGIRFGQSGPDEGTATRPFNKIGTCGGDCFQKHRTG
jgi:hypothetical protein